MSSLLPRIDLFEFHDTRWVPALLRRSVVDALGLTTDWGRLLSGLIQPLEQFLERTHATTLLELCSGSGRMAALLAAEMRQRGAAPARIILSDKAPRPVDWRRLSESNDALAYVSDPVDATRVSTVESTHPRLIANALHHFPPPLARAVLRDAVQRTPGIFVCENFPRNPLATLGPGLPGAIAVLGAPLALPEGRLWRGLLTWLLPVIPLMFFWDGLASSLRVYTEVEIRDMLDGLDCELTFGRFPLPYFGRGTYFQAINRTWNPTS